MQLTVLKIDMVVDEIWLKLSAGCVMDNLRSPDIGETLPKFCLRFQQEKKYIETNHIMLIS